MSKISSRKVLIILICIALLLVLYFFGIISFSKALPFQTCGGSTLDAKECTSGFSCERPGAEKWCIGCGGVCVPNLK